MQRRIGFIERLVIGADDVNPGEDDRYIALSTQHAREIAMFVKRMSTQADTLVVHCRMGLSRSSAAAQAIAEALSIDDAEIMNQNVIPNRLVHDVIAEALRGD